jgi:hypothetical protein
MTPRTVRSIRLAAIALAVVGLLGISVFAWKTTLSPEPPTNPRAVDTAVGGSTAPSGKAPPVSQAAAELTSAAVGKPNQRGSEPSRSASRPSTSADWPVRAGIEDGDSYHNVKSPEEAAWLNERWYANQEELEYANSIGSSAELPENLIPRSARDIATARIVALDPSRRSDALSVLHNAANQGSVYALRAIGEFHEGAGRFPIANAYFRAALFAGDWHISLRPALGNAQQEAVVSLQAMSIIDGINQRRAMRRMPPLPIVVRPGYQLFLTALLSRKP